MSKLSTPVDLTGRVFGKWEVLHFSHSKMVANHLRRYWVCECECGQIATVLSYRLTGGKSTMCKPCGQKRGTEGATTHGNARRNQWSATYHSWKAMRSRCLNPNHEHYPDYGGRGITVCDRWRGADCFANFLADMGERPEGCTLDRIENDLGYFKANCHWATATQQANNQRRRRPAKSKVKGDEQNGTSI
jgi:hypothetical protein